MPTASLHAISPLDGRYASALDELREITSEYGLIRFRIIIELKWLCFLVTHVLDLSTTPNLEPLQTLCDNINESHIQQVKTIEATTNHDVKAVEYFLQQQLEQHPDLAELIPYIHFGCTSEDINNLAYGLMLQHARHLLHANLNTLSQNLDQLAHEHAQVSLLSRTHGQAATPTTLGKELRNIEQRLQRQMQRFLDCQLLGKMNGAVGNFNAHVVALPKANWPALGCEFVESLGLQYNAHTTQIEPHDGLAEYLHTLMRIHTILIDCSRDLWQYISVNYFAQRKAEHEVGSSTMPHKVNPIDFENAEANLGIAHALAAHLAHKLPISRLQRDLSDSSALRNIGVVVGHSLIASKALLRGLNKLVVNHAVIAKDLQQHWELLAEPIQMVLRTHGKIDAYEQLKALTRGADINQERIQKFINTLDIPDSSKAALLALSPENYIGLAAVLAKESA